MRSFHVRVRGIELACDVHGEGERALVLVHGYTGGRRDFVHVAPRLARAGRRVIVIEQRGHGASTWLRERAAYSMEPLVDDLHALLDALGIARADLVGHSMGGQVVARLALAAPERVRSLALVATWAGGLDLWPRRSLHTRLLDASAPVRRAVDAYHRARGRVVPEPPSDMDPEAWRALPEAMRSTDLRPRLGSLDVPAAVVVGSRDRPFVPHAAALARALPRASLITFDHAGHAIPGEQPQAFADALEQHLAT